MGAYIDVIIESLQYLMVMLLFEKRIAPAEMIQDMQDIEREQVLNAAHHEAGHVLVMLHGQMISKFMPRVHYARIVTSEPIGFQLFTEGGHVRSKVRARRLRKSGWTEMEYLVCLAALLAGMVNQRRVTKTSMISLIVGGSGDLWTLLKWLVADRVAENCPLSLRIYGAIVVRIARFQTALWIAQSVIAVHAPAADAIAAHLIKANGRPVSASQLMPYVRYCQRTKPIHFIET
ncbi:MAG: hypothetical protein A3C15_00935 [Candidatus Magasanikbacteria bacterium RIFCSPHIGHO2_02_FULL_50_9b]|uniref:Peptidase M41 domain-containing protein n=1 Tax=Candidatus Magasanikbacteria bacterium RIFCSPHIGHO2_02_FULL_50_9b TaxID=1798682 RepID=A0A1F6M8V1_9BACT|nr:MAG: hypothetical protein A3C15_00935 [Candidatus Magasanikbacteria bacterium RIFCSPHIGHO2_02_FULL_50_9b]